MTHILSAWAREFLREDRVAVISTLNTDGSPQVTTSWYLLQEDGTLIMSTPCRTQKVKILRRDPRIALCVGDERRSVSRYGTAAISEDQNVVRRDLEQLAVHYIKEETARAPAMVLFLQHPRDAQRGVYKPAIEQECYSPKWYWNFVRWEKLWEHLHHPVRFETKHMTRREEIVSQA